MSVIFTVLGARVVAMWTAALAAAVRAMLTERSHRMTVLTVAKAVPRGGLLVDEWSDGRKITIDATGSRGARR